MADEQPPNEYSVYACELRADIDMECYSIIGKNVSYSFDLRFDQILIDGIEDQVFQIHLPLENAVCFVETE